MKNAMQKLMGLAAFALAAMFGLTASAADVAEVVSADGQAVTGYATLQAAFDAVEAGGTVRLVDNVSLAASSYYTNGVASTFDLAGRTVSVESTASYGAVYVKSGTMTLADTVGTGEITGSATGLRLEGTGKLVMNGGRITITRTATSGTAQGIFLAGQTEATLNGGTVSVTGTQNKVSVYGIYLNGCSGKLSINGARILCTAYTAQSSSSYKSSAIQCNSASADVKVTAGEIYMYGGYNAYGLFISGGSNRSVLISGGNFYAYSSKTSAAAVSGYTANTIITGGNFYSYKYGAVSQAYPVANAIVRGGKFAREVIAAPAYKMQALSPTEEITINDKTVTMTQTVVADPDATPVARVKSTQSTYNSVQEAMEAAAATDTVELMDDASTGFFPVTGWAGKTLTLDLAGHSLDGTGLTGALTGPSAITVYGSLTLTNSVPASGTLVATKFGIYVWSGADFTLAGGKVSVTSTWTSTQCAGITGGGTARVSGGTLQVDGAEPIVAGFYMSAGTFSVSGGNVFVRSTTSGKKGYVSYQGSGSVTGGKFAIETNSGTVSRFYSATVTGGSFTFDPSSYLPLGNKKVVDTGTETVTPFETELTLAYEVVTDPDAPYRAENLTTGTKYYVPQTAIDEARDGETVRMLADVSLNGGYLSITNGITFDLNGHTVTSKTSTVQMTGGTDAQPIRIVDTAAVKGVIAGESAIRAASGAKCHAVVDGVTLFGTLRLFFDESGTSATDRSSLLLTNVTGRVVPNSTAPNAYRCGLSAKYSNILLADCDFTVDAPNQKPSKLTTSYYQTMFRFASATASSTVTVDGGSYRVIVGDNAYVNMAAYDASKPNLIVKDGLFAIETGATPQSVCFYAATNTAAIYGSNISLAGGDYTENIDPTQWIVRNRYVADSAIAGYVYHVKELTLENSTAMIVTGDVTNFYMFVTKALEDATAGDVVEVANPSAEAVSLPTGVSLKSNGKFTGTVTSVSPMHKIIETDGVYATVAYTADDAEAMVDCGSVTNYYGALTNAILAANGNGYRVTLLRDIVLGDVPCQAYDSYLEMYIRSLLPEMDTITLDGWDATLGRAHTITDSGSNDWLHAIVSTESVTIENLSFRNMSSSLVEDAFGQLTMRNVDVEGVLYADGNVGVYCTYCWGDATFENCTNRADVVGSGVYTDYDAIFVAYTGSSSYSQTLSFTNCVNAGRAQAGKLAMFIGNPCGSKDLVLNVSGCENRGSLVATFVYENTPLGEYDDYNMNWYMAVDSNCPHIILNGESVDASTLNFENITVDSTHGIVNADGGVVCNGPVETGMRLYEFADKTFEVIPATGNQVTNIAFGGMSDVAYYRVSVGLYVSLAGSSGSSRVYATETFDANDTNGFETALMNLDFVDLDYVDGAETDLLAGNTVFTTNGVTYYVVDDDKYTTNGEVWEAEFRHVTAFDAEDRLLATATLGLDLENVAVIGKVKYATLGLAMADAKAGDTVVLLNATDESVEMATGVKFDTNGKDYTGTLTAPGGSFIRDNGDGTYGSFVIVAEIRTASATNRYESLAAAFSAVGDGETITLVKASYTNEPSVAVSGERIALDLNGHTLTSCITLSAGNLTLTNGTILAASESDAAVTVTGGALAIAEGAKVKGAGAVQMNGGTLNVTGGTVQGVSTNAVLFGKGAAAVIAGGTFLAPEGLCTLAYDAASTAEGAYPTNFVWAALDAEEQETGYPLFSSTIPNTFIGFGYTLKDNQNGTWTVTAGNVEIKTVVEGGIVANITNTVSDMTAEEAQTATNQVEEIQGDVVAALQKTNDDDLTGTGINEATKNADGSVQPYVLDALTNAAPESAKDLIDTNSTIECYIEIKLQSLDVTVATNVTETTSRVIESTLTSITYDIKPIVTTKVTTGDTVVTVTTNLEGQTLSSPVTFKLDLQKTFPSDIAKVTHTHNGEEIVERCVVETGDDGSKWITLTWTQFCMTVAEAEEITGYACWANGNIYESLTNALEDATLPEDATIVLLKDCGETDLPLGYDRVIDRHGHAFTGSLSPADPTATETVFGSDGTVYIASNAVDVATSSTTTLPIRGYAFPDGTAEADKPAYLAAEDAYGRPRWQTYILGANAKLIPEIVPAASEGISTVVIKAADGFTVNTPAKSGTTVSFNLLRKEQGGAYQSVANAALPYFQVDVKDLADKTFWKIQTVYESTEE